MVWEGVGGYGRVWEVVGGCGMVWEGVGRCQRGWDPQGLDRFDRLESIDRGSLKGNPLGLWSTCHVKHVIREVRVT